MKITDSQQNSIIRLESRMNPLDNEHLELPALSVLTSKNAL